jgi:tetratricopeptide (TPR) repeat protein
MFGSVAALGLLGAVLLSTLMFGAVSGEEFCPDTFCRRSFLYYELPLVGVQITPIRRQDQTGDLEKHLTKNNFVPSGKATPQWHLVNCMRAGASRVRGDAAILCEYLDASADKNDLYWKAWTEKHPELAKILWPAVAQTASRHLYVFIPDLFELARGVSDATALQRDVNTTLARRYRQLAEFQQQLGEHDTAVELLDRALIYAPNDAALRQRRAESLRVLGRS